MYNTNIETELQSIKNKTICGDVLYNLNIDFLMILN